MVSLNDVIMYLGKWITLYWLSLYLTVFVSVQFNLVYVHFDWNSASIIRSLMTNLTNSTFKLTTFRSNKTVQIYIITSNLMVKPSFEKLPPFDIWIFDIHLSCIISCTHHEEYWRLDMCSLPIYDFKYLLLFIHQFFTCITLTLHLRHGASNYRNSTVCSITYSS